MIPPVIFHLDLDAFFASVEQLDHPQWRGQPVIVGALPGGRGVVATCSYEARTFGVRSALPISEAYRLCPQGIFVKPRMERYHQLSRQVMELLRATAPRFQQMSVDEAYLDLSGTRALLGPEIEVASRLKKSILSSTGLKVSIGIAPTWYLAKIASDFGKPDGLFVIDPDGMDDFLEALPLKKLHGAGGKTRQRLEDCGVTTVSALRTFSWEALRQLVGEGSADFLFRACRGQADYNPFREAQSRSISAETTFGEDTADLEVLETTLKGLCQEVTFRALDEGWKSRTPHLKLRWSDFTTVSAQTTLARPIVSSTEFYRVIRQLFASRWTQGRPVRLIGVGLGSLEEAYGPEQADLFEGEVEKQGKVEKALAELRKKRPEGAEVVRASLLGKKRRGD
jgi:DNA polymerase-4